MSARTILTLANGRGLDLLHPQPSDISWAVVGEHLAKEKRFNGATPEFEYSVGEHSVRGADAAASAIARGELDAERFALLPAYFLLHDGHEHALKDDTTPKKHALAEIAHEAFGLLAEQILACFDQLTERHDAAIHAAAGLPWPPAPDIAKAVKTFDLIMFVTEWRDLMRGVEHPNWDAYRAVTPLPERIAPWSWSTARTAFLMRCRLYLPCFADDRTTDITTLFYRERAA